MNYRLSVSKNLTDVRRILWACVLLFPLALPTSAWAVLNWTGVSLEPSEIVEQPGDSTGAAALYNSLALGSPELRELLPRLGPGEKENKAQALESALLSIGNDSAFNGTTTTDVAKLNAILRSLQQPQDLVHLKGGYLVRHNSHTPGSFVARVHRAFVQSLSKHVPLVLLLGIYNGSTRLAGQFVTVAQITAEQRDHLSFNIKYLDSSEGKFKEALIYEEVKRSFHVDLGGAFRNNPKLIDGRIQVSQMVVNSPVLKIHAPALQTAAPSSLIVVEAAFGSFTSASTAAKIRRK